MIFLSKNEFSETKLHFIGMYFYFLNYIGLFEIFGLLLKTFIFLKNSSY